MVALTCALGAFFPYLGSSQLIYSEVYDRGSEFPLWFGLAALAMGATSISNSRIVGRIGSVRALEFTQLGYLAAGGTFLLTGVIWSGRPPFVLFFVLTTILLSGHAVLSALLNSMAMSDVGHIAGTASAVIGTVSFLGGSALSSIVDRFITSSITPFALGFLVYGTIAYFWARWALRGVA
jgi:DHA1 family bicyclomycin/chloramphenicol resistance-like MFS transporter